MEDEQHAIRKCQRCAKDMTYGHVFGWPRSDMSIGAKIAWLPGTIQPTGGGLRDWLTGERLATVEPIKYRMGSPMYPAWRCDECKCIEFLFKEDEVDR